MNFTSQIHEVNLSDGKDFTSEIKEIIQFEGNNTCADCVSPSNSLKVSTYALDISCVCLNTLVILCEKCAFIHMKYGFDVKLLTDKQWDSQILNVRKLQLSFLTLLGS